MAPRSPGREESRDRLGIRVQLQPGGGEGPPLTLNAATRPWPREARPGLAGPWAKPVLRTPGFPALGGGDRAPCSWQPGGRAEPGVVEGGLPVHSCLARQKLAFISRHLPSAAPKLFALAPSPQAGMQPPYPRPGVRNRERGPGTPSAGLRRPRTSGSVRGSA